MTFIDLEFGIGPIGFYMSFCAFQVVALCYVYRHRLTTTLQKLLIDTSVDHWSRSSDPKADAASLKLLSKSLRQGIKNGEVSRMPSLELKKDDDSKIAQSHYGDIPDTCTDDDDDSELSYVPSFTLTTLKLLSKSLRQGIKNGEVSRMPSLELKKDDDSKIAQSHYGDIPDTCTDDDDDSERSYVPSFTLTTLDDLGSKPESYNQEPMNELEAHTVGSLGPSWSAEAMGTSGPIPPELGHISNDNGCACGVSSKGINCISASPEMVSLEVMSPEDDKKNNTSAQPVSSAKQ